MYQRNPISRNVLITPQEVIKKSAASQTLDPSKVEAAIEIAEERFIRDALGSDYYDYLIDTKNKIVTADNIVDMQQKINAAYGVEETTDDSRISEGDVINSFFFLPAADQKLWMMYLWKMTAEAVIFVATPTNYADFTSQGIVKNNPETSILGTGNSSGGSVGITLNDVKWLMDKSLQDRINPLIGAMHKWLCKNIGAYPRYTNKCECETDDSIPGSQVTGWVTSLYDNEDERGCGC